MRSPWVRGRRAPEAEGAPLASPEGADPDVQVRRRLQGHGGAVAGDVQPLDEYPPSLHRLVQLEVDLITPALIVRALGQDDGLGDGRGHRHQDGGHDRDPAPAGPAASALQRLGHGAGTLPASAALAPLAEPGVGAEGHPPVAPVSVLAVLLAHPAKDTLRPLGHEAQGAGAGLDRLRRRGRLAPHQLGDRPGVEPRPQPVLEQVGGHQGQFSAAYLAHDHRDARQAEQDGNRHPHLGRADRGVAVRAVGQGAHRRDRHDLGEGEP